MRISSSGRRALWAAALTASSAIPSLAATKDWSGGTGNWDNPSNWTPGGVPTANDDVNLAQAGATVTYIEPASVSLHDVSIGAVGGTTLVQTQDAFHAFSLTVGQSALTTGTYDFSGGSLLVQGTTTISNGGIFTGSANYNSFGLLRFTGGQMSGTGTTTVGSGQSLAFIGSTNSAIHRTLINSGAATWEGTASIGGSGTFVNNAVFDISASTATAFSMPSFLNTGTVHKISGTSTFFGGVCTFDNIGLLKVDASTTVHLNGTVPQRSGTLLTGGQWYVAGTLNMPQAGPTIDTIGSGASVTLDGTGSTFTLIDPLATNAGSFTVTNGRNFTTIGTLSNTGTLTVGTGSTLTLTGLTQLSAGTLSAGAYFIGGTLVLPSAVTTNQAQINLNAGYVCAALSTLATNQGTINVGAGATYTAGVLNNSGYIGAQGGTVNLPAGGTHSGTFAANIGTINFSGGTHTFNGSTLNTPAGFGTIAISGTATVTSSSDWTVAENTTWSGGTITGTGHVLVSATRQLKLLGSIGRTLNTTIENSGTVTWEGGSGLNGTGVIENLAGGLFQIQNTGGTAIGIPTFNNAGTITKTGSGGMPSSNFGGVLTLNNTGTVDVQSGQLNINGTITQATTSTLTGGTWMVSGSGLLALNGAPSLTTIGPAATVELSGSGSSLNKINTLANNQGHFTITNGRNFTTAGALKNGGIMAIGPSSTLTLGGTLDNDNTVSISGTLDIKNQKMVTVWSYSTAVSIISSGAVTTSSDFAGLTTVAAAPATDTSYVGGTFGGVSVTAFDTLVMYTLAGDADLNAVVDADDYFRIDSNYNKLPATLTYSRGDFNYDGVIDGDDYSLIDASFSGQAGFSPSPPAGVTAVPEPTSVAWLALAAATLRRRRRDMRAAS